MTTTTAGRIFLRIERLSHCDGFLRQLNRKKGISPIAMPTRFARMSLVLKRRMPSSPCSTSDPTASSTAISSHGHTRRHSPTTVTRRLKPISNSSPTNMAACTRWSPLMPSSLMRLSAMDAPPKGSNMAKAMPTR